jgi:hypothetical protein
MIGRRRSGGTAKAINVHTGGRDLDALLRHAFESKRLTSPARRSEKEIGSRDRLATVLPRMSIPVRAE